MKKIAFLVSSVLFLGMNLTAQKSLRLWYDEPARAWEETLPLGNGRLGMMPDGGVSMEKIVLNEITLWSGAPQDANNYDAHKNLPQIRKLLLEGKNDEAEALVNRTFVCEGKGSGFGNGANVPFGCYQVLGNLNLKFDYDNGSEPAIPKNYIRQLSLNDAIASCSFEINNVGYEREYFTSFDDDISIIRLSASKPGKLNFTISLDRPEQFAVKAENGELQMYGQLNNGTDGKGMEYLTNIQVGLSEGALMTTENSLIIKNASEALIYVSAATSFRNSPFREKAKSLLADARKKPFEAQKREHIKNFQKLFKRVDFKLGDTDADELPTNKRLAAFYKNPERDNEMAVLYFQFGRYLSISSTRIGLLPPNLQGLWANQVQTPWNGDYHMNVNVQMNHWPLEVANLSELNLPLIDLVKRLVEPGGKTAKAYYNANGWVAHVITNPWSFTEPGEQASWGASTGSGWLCNNLWEHYDFTLDKNYLKEIYPVLKGAAQYYSSALIKDPATGWLVTGPSVSPENAFYMPNGKVASICMGPTIDNQIVRELFGNVISASAILGLDKPFRDALQKKMKSLPPAGRVASDGRLMEWLQEYKEVEPQHRHVSHLYGVYPAALISPEKTPDLAKAAKASLEVRGDGGTGWSKAYKLLFWARLQDGNRAYKLLTQLLQPTGEKGVNMSGGGGTYPNLFCAHPPFQIDGNFGGTAGIAEMLLQSHAGYINLLPALPDAWKTGGEIKGLKARGNFTVDMVWKDGQVTEYKIFSAQPQKIKVKVNGEIKELRSEKI